MSFPSSPTNGQQATLNGILYEYSSSEGTWTRIGTTISGSIDNVARILAATASANSIYTQGVVASQNTKIQAAFDQANTASSNTIYTQGVDVWQNTRITSVDSFAQAAYNQANSAAAASPDQVARDTANTAASNTVILQGVNTAQNTRITFVEGHSQAAFTQANLALATGIAIQDEVNIIKNVNITQNTRIQAAFDKANTGGGITSLGGFAANNVLTVNSAGYISNTANLNFYNSNNTLVVTGNVVGGGIRSTTSENPPDNPVIGDIWYETGTDVIYRYTNDGGSSYWIDVSGPEFSGSSPAHRSIAEFVATANQNSFSTVYNVNSVDVLRNGLRLPSTDYVANNGTSIILDTPCNANDVVTIINFYTTSLNVVLTANTRPSGIANGTILWNSANNVLETFIGTGWSTLASQSYSVDYLVVAGGGGGGGYHGAGGGAGGYLASSLTVTPISTYTITVGAGGAGAASGSSTFGANGSNSSLASTAISIGGGGGAYQSSQFAPQNGQPGGSGGGGSGAMPPSGAAATGGAGTAGQGYAGGSGNGYWGSTSVAGGGGGGASAVGQNASNTGNNGGNGGAGNAWSNGTTYAGGGGGRGETTKGTGGLGGGGNGGDNSTPASSATTNTGGGGGGGHTSIAGNGGNGGSGIVIIRYLGSQRGTGGTLASANGYTYHTFTTSGTFTA